MNQLSQVTTSVRSNIESYKQNVEKYILILCYLKLTILGSQQSTWKEVETNG